MIRFVRSVTVVRRSPGTVDAYGNKALTTVDTITTTGELQQMASSENQTDRDTVVSDWMLLLPAGTTVARFDTATIDGQTYEVIGVPEVIVSPFTGATSHVEAQVRATVG